LNAESYSIIEPRTSAHRNKNRIPPNSYFRVPYGDRRTLWPHSLRPATQPGLPSPPNLTRLPHNDLAVPSHLALPRVRYSYLPAKASMARVEMAVEVARLL